MILAVRRLRQKDQHEFKASLGFVETLLGERGRGYES